MLFWLAVLFATGAHLPPSAREPASFIVRTWDTGDGLPQNSVTSILQTRDGYLWLGAPIQKEGL